jgi:hypothetical protein
MPFRNTGNPAYELRQSYYSSKNTGPSSRDESPKAKVFIYGLSLKIPIRAAGGAREDSSVDGRVVGDPRQEEVVAPPNPQS